MHAHKDAITEEAIGIEFDDATRQVKHVSAAVYSELTGCSSSGPLQFINGVANGSGLEAFQLLVKRYEPHMLATTMVYLTLIVTSPWVEQTEDMDR